MTLKLTCLLTMLLAVATSTSPGQTTPSPAVALPIMPLPLHLEPGQGVFPITSALRISFVGYTGPRLTRAGDRMLAILARETGTTLNAARGLEASGANQLDGKSSTRFLITTKGASEPIQQLGEDESYRLEITPTGVHLTAPNPLGVLHGLQTFLQLVVSTPTGSYVPAVVIDDGPRFPWRGLMIDASRHFQPVEVIKRNLDGMEAVKLNVFHWHLSDNQGFRVESLRYPLLHEKGSDGLFYTQAQVRQIVAYARDRGIRVVPEFDMPGHSTSWFVGYPELASAPGPYSIETHWGVFDPAMDPTRDATYTFLDGLIGEMAGLFPDAYFHIGGDECNGKQWDSNPRIQEFMRAHGIVGNAALQAYFTARVERIVAGHHKIMEGWDEVLQPGTPKDVVIQSWRGPDSLAEAAHRGYSGLLSAGYYIDLNYPASDHYVADPLGGKAATLTPEEQQRILGGEATMWSEFTTPEIIDSRIWPRTAAIAERLWSPQSVTDVASMYQRLAIVSNKLQIYGLQHRVSYPAILKQMAGKSDTTALKTLADVVEPPKVYVRGTLREYTNATPLNRLVDAVPPESETAREFKLLVDRIVSNHASPADWENASTSLTLWRDNHARLQPLLTGSEALEELAPASANLNRVASVGLQALDSLLSHRALPTGWAIEELDFLKKSERPQAAVINQITPSVERLVAQAALVP
jgi:hexosaminidase